MMRPIYLMLFILVSIVANGQVKFTNDEITRKNDSILAEGNLLYRYEKAAWVSTDIANDLKEIRHKQGGYFIYQSGDTIKAIIMDKKGENCIYELSYLNNFTNPAKELFDIRALNAKEKQLMTVRDELIGKVFTPNYKIGIVDGFDFNIQLIPYALGYKLYLISGTSKSDLIPFGNDYLFFADKRGAITSWRKFHSRIIPTMTKYKGETVMSVMHSHLPQEPFITATDICTFKLYGGLAGLKSFKVLSTALNKVFSYDLEGDRIGVEEM